MDIDLTVFHELQKEADLLDLAEDLCQKERNGKRLITDVAISKVPYVVYPDLNASQNLAVHELAEYLLQTAKTKNNSNEVAITCNLKTISVSDGTEELLKNVGINFGTENVTSLWSDTVSAHILNSAGAVTILNLHNHPSCSTFSVEDISVFLKVTAIKLMVLVGNDGEIYYLSKDLERYNFNKAMRYFQNVTEVVAPDAKTRKVIRYQESREIADLFLKNCRIFGIDYRHELRKNLSKESFKDIEEETSYDDKNPQKGNY